MDEGLYKLLLQLLLLASLAGVTGVQAQGTAGTDNPSPVLTDDKREGPAGHGEDSLALAYGRLTDDKRTGPTEQPAQRNELLTDEEAAWVDSHSVSVGIEEWPPLVFTRDDGSPGGLAVAILKRISIRTGLHFEFVHNRWEFLLRGLRNREIDLLPATYYTDERATYGLYSSPYFQMIEFVYVRNDNAQIRKLDDLAEGRIAVVKDFGTIPKLRKRYPRATIIETENLLSSIFMVINGTADALLESQAAVEKALLDNAIRGLQSINQEVFPPSPIHLFSRIDEPLLHSILEKGLGTISKAERTEDVGKWISANIGLHPEASSAASAVNEKTSSMWPLATAAFFILLLVSIVIFMLPRIITDEFIAQHFGSLHFNVALIGLTAIVAFVIMALVWTTLENTRKAEVAWVENELQSTLNYNLKILDDWIAERKGYLAVITRNTKLLDLTRSLLHLDTSASTQLQTSPIHQEAHKFFMSRAAESRSSSHSILSQERIIVHSMREVDIGTTHFLARQFPTLVDRAFAGAVVLIPAISSENMAGNQPRLEHASNRMSLFILAPMQDTTGDTTCILVQEHDPSGDLSRLIQRSIFGSSGESYLISRTGDMITRSRFQSDLQRIGLVNTYQDSVSLKNPGGDLMQGFEPRQSHDRLPFTDMVKPLIQDAGMNTKQNRSVSLLEPYYDYRGIPVVGIGYWKQDLNIGLVSEIDAAEALAHFELLRWDLLVVVVVTVTLMAAFSLIAVSTGHRATRYMRRATDDLEFKVEQRTTELNEAVMRQDKLLHVQKSQNTELAVKNEQLAEANDTIAASINYATHIQHSILPADEYLRSFAHDIFIIWEPRDKVGGDMYWCKPWGLGKMLALGDCTGHGVPGALMTLITQGCLEVALLETMPGDTSTLLSRTHQLIQGVLGQDRDEGESNDGLELGVLYAAPDRKKITFSGARFSLFHSADGAAVTEIKGDKRGLGYRGVPQDLPFTVHELENFASHTFFMTTDGLLDQVGGVKQRGFGKRRLKELLSGIQHLQFTEQRTRIVHALKDYQGDQKRRDDVSVIGFKLSMNSTGLQQ